MNYEASVNFNILKTSSFYTQRSQTDICVELNVFSADLVKADAAVLVLCGFELRETLDPSGCFLCESLLV